MKESRFFVSYEILGEKSTIAPSPYEGSTALPSTSVEGKKKEETQTITSEEKKEVHKEVENLSSRMI